MEDRYDVAILGGGLAGLTLGIQLKQARPESSVLVTLGRKGRAPEAAFKVGESTVEISAYYFAQVIGLEDHIEESHLHKNGLRYFFPADGNHDITQRLELGPRREADVPTYQLDRGRFENKLWDKSLEVGVELLDDCKVSDVDFGEEEHAVQFTRGGEPQTVRARWVVDTTGTYGLLRRKFDSTVQVEHHANASWFRLAGGLKLDDWSDDPDWHGRMEQRDRWQSTNHLLGEGYWVWLIPLASGPISIGVVTDPRYHPYEELTTLDGVLAFIERNEPQLYSYIADRREEVQDFLTRERFSYGCERVFSTERWAMSGEAGVFIDPFYSPGSDFIAMANTFITDVVIRDMAGEEITPRLEFFNAHLLQLHAAFMNLYTDQYAGFGNPMTTPAKFAWDHIIYWGISCPRFMNGRITDLEFTQQVGQHVLGVIGLTQRMQVLFRKWRELVPPEPRSGFIDMQAAPGITERWNALAHRIEDADELLELYAGNVRFLQAMAIQIFAEAASSLPGEPLPADARINPNAMSLEPDKWEEEGLFNGEGMTLAEAREIAPGLEHIWSREAVRSA